jgi:beta-1,4-mannosyltransferase
MRVAFVPVWDSNPYHRELERAIRSLGTDVFCPKSLKSLYADYVAGKEKLDVLHLHALPYFGLSPLSMGRYGMFYFRLNQLRQLGVRVVWTVHDFQNHDSRYWQIEDFANHSFSRRLDAMIVHGEAAKRIIESRWRKHTCKMIFVIPHGNYIQSYKNEMSAAAARTFLGLEESNLVFLFLGLIRPYKGVVEMVRAFRTCEDPNLRLIITGRPVGKAIKNEVELAIRGDSRIKFLPGHVENDKVQFYMKASDAMVLPYQRVFTSGAAILAMSFGKPCIAPRAGCVTDSLDEKGAVLFDPLVNGDLERAFREILTCRHKLAEMGRYNLERAAGWDWQSIGQKTVAVYEGCLELRKKTTKKTLK